MCLSELTRLYFFHEGGMCLDSILLRCSSIYQSISKDSHTLEAREMRYGIESPQCQLGLIGEGPFPQSFKYVCTLIVNYCMQIKLILS